MSSVTGLGTEEEKLRNAAFASILGDDENGALLRTCEEAFSEARFRGFRGPCRPRRAQVPEADEKILLQSSLIARNSKFATRNSKFGAAEEEILRNRVHNLSSSCTSSAPLPDQGMSLRRWRGITQVMSKAGEEMSGSATGEVVAEAQKQRSVLETLKRKLQWVRTSREDIIESEKRLLTLVQTPHVVEQVNIGSGPPGSKVRWFRSASNEPRFINTVTFEKPAAEAPTIVLVHGYGASQGFFFRNFDALASKFRVMAVDQLGWGASSRPDFSCKTTEETESWFIDSLEEWRKAKNLDNFILLGHSLGGYIATRYALKYPEHVKHLVLVGPAGVNEGSDRLMQFRSTWKGAVANFIWESNFTPQALVRGLGPWGPGLVKNYAGNRFGGKWGSGSTLADEEATRLSDYMYHTLAARASGELCLKYIFSFGALARTPLVDSAPDLKVPTSFIYGIEDWMDYRGAVAARQRMNVPCEIIRVPKSGHFVFMDNAPTFHNAVFYACRQYLPGGSDLKLPKGTTPGVEKQDEPFLV